MIRRMALAALMVAWTGGSACDQQKDTGGGAPRQSLPAATPEPAKPAVAVAPPVPAAPSPSTDTAPPAPGMSTVKFHGCAMEIPGAWMVRPPTSSMRVAQFEWPKAPGDTEKAEMIVFFFGESSGGSVADNLDRWRGQFVEEGEPTPGEVTTLASPHAKITLLDKSGTFKWQPRTMAADFTPKPDWRMLAAIIEFDGGPYFIRVTGPKAGVVAQREAFVEAVKSFRKSGS